MLNQLEKNNDGQTLQLFFSIVGDEEKRFSTLDTRT
jgi:hypothetical protein